MNLETIYVIISAEDSDTFSQAKYKFILKFPLHRVFL